VNYFKALTDAWLPKRPVVKVHDLRVDQEFVLPSLHHLVEWPPLAADTCSTEYRPLHARSLCSDQDKEQTSQENQDKEQTSQENQDKEQTSQENQDKEQTSQESQDKEQTSQENQDKEQTSQESQDKEQTSQENVNIIHVDLFGKV
jgi:Mg-chelatase subunit ChlI